MRMLWTTTFNLILSDRLLRLNLNGLIISWCCSGLGGLLVSCFFTGKLNLFLGNLIRLLIYVGSKGVFLVFIVEIIYNSRLIWILFRFLFKRVLWHGHLLEHFCFWIFNQPFFLRWRKNIVHRRMLYTLLLTLRFDLNLNFFGLFLDGLLLISQLDHIFQLFNSFLFRLIVIHPSWLSFMFTIDLIYCTFEFIETAFHEDL